MGLDLARTKRPSIFYPLNSITSADASTDCDQDRPQRSNWRGGCIITTEGVRLDARKKGPIAGSDCRSGPLERRKHCAARVWLPGNPAVCYRPRRPEFIWGMSVYEWGQVGEQVTCRSVPPSLWKVVRKESAGKTGLFYQPSARIFSSE